MTTLIIFAIIMWFNEHGKDDEIPVISNEGIWVRKKEKEDDINAKFKKEN